MLIEAFVGELSL